jgi:hypothetical protein
MSTQLKLRRHGISTSGGISHRVMRIIVESAALYSLNHLLYVILYEVKNQVESTPSFLVSLPQILLSVGRDGVYVNSTGSDFGHYHL